MALSICRIKFILNKRIMQTLLYVNIRLKTIIIFTNDAELYT